MKYGQTMMNKKSKMLQQGFFHYVVKQTIQKNPNATEDECVEYVKNHWGKENTDAPEKYDQYWRFSWTPTSQPIERKGWSESEKEEAEYNKMANV